MERCPKGERISKKVPEKNMKLPSQRCDPQTKKEFNLPWTEMVIENVRDFPGGPVVKTRSYHSEGAQVQILMREPRSHTPHSQKSKT